MALWQDVASTSQNGREHNNLVVKRFANGDEYHGRWHNGFPDGDGVYKWADGSR